MMAAASQSRNSQREKKPREGVVGMAPVSEEQLHQLHYQDAQMVSERTERTSDENQKINKLIEMFPMHAIETIEETLERCQWNIDAAAQQLSKDDTQWHTSGKKKKEKKTTQKPEFGERQNRPRKPDEHEKKPSHIAAPQEQNTNKPKEERKERKSDHPHHSETVLVSYSPGGAEQPKGKGKFGAASSAPSWADIAKTKQQPKEEPRIEMVTKTFETTTIETPKVEPVPERVEPAPVVPEVVPVVVPVPEAVVVPVEPVIVAVPVVVPAAPVVVPAPEPVVEAAPVVQAKPKPKYVSEAPLVIKFQPSAAEAPKVKFGFTAAKEKPVPQPEPAPIPVQMPEPQPKVQEPIASRSSVPQALMQFTNQQPQFAQAQVAAPGPVSPPGAFAKGFGGLPQPQSPTQQAYQDQSTFAFERSQDYSMQHHGDFAAAANQQRMGQPGAASQQPQAPQPSLGYGYEPYGALYGGYPMQMYDYYGPAMAQQHQDYPAQPQSQWSTAGAQNVPRYNSYQPHRQEVMQQQQPRIPAAQLPGSTAQLQGQQTYGHNPAANAPQYMHPYGRAYPMAGAFPSNAGAGYPAAGSQWSYHQPTQ